MLAHGQIYVSQVSSSEVVRRRAAGAPWKRGGGWEVQSGTRASIAPGGSLSFTMMFFTSACRVLSIQILRATWLVGLYRFSYFELNTEAHMIEF